MNGLKPMAMVLVLGSIFGSTRSFAASQETEPQGAELAAEANPNAEVGGIELGEFRIRSYYPVEAQKSRVRFMLYATAPSDRFAQLQELVEAHRHKIRDQVITATRLAPLSLFDEPELKGLRRLILVRLQRALPELPIADIYVSDFQLTMKSL